MGFHSISAILLSKGLHYSSHSQVIGNFNKEFVKSGIFPPHFTKIIQRLFEERQTGDYDFDTYIVREDAERDISDTRNLIAECDKYLITIGMNKTT